ncbi:hemerythrin domain-containing protein [Kitasatospora sp. NPDC006697]|uniref:hemerythrin domain-containing protein n=1 Tax=Kitasatospora sp. NPDC006697 TaxID=3364020 RepID=UPI00367E4F4E
MTAGSDLLTELSADHRTIRELCTEFGGLPPGDGRRKPLLDRLAALLVRHGRTEEACLHPLLRHRPDHEAVAGRGRSEHRAIAELLTELTWRAPDAPGFDRLAADLVARVTAHLDAEEATAFPAAAGAAPAGELDHLGERARRSRTGGPATEHAAAGGLPGTA